MPGNVEDGARVCVRNLWKVFGKNPQVTLESDLGKSGTKEEVREKTGAVIAVRDVSFDVRTGETFVVMGLSGCGKSTLARCLIRLVEPTSGEIFIDNEDINQYDARQLIELRRRKTGLVFQHFGLLPHRRVIDNAAYGLEVQGVSRDVRYQRAREVLERVGLKGWDDAYPSELSGGMQQRVGLARALTVDPEILIMDEPFSGLDPLIRREMQDELGALQEQLRKTIVFITHDLNEALKLGNRIAIMRDGEIVQLGTPEEIVMLPADDYVSAFVQDVSKAKVLTARSVMQEPELVLHESQGPRVALYLMKANDLAAAFLVGPGRVLRGILTLDRAAEAADQSVNTLTGAGTDIDLNVVGPDTPVEYLVPMAAMSEHPIAVVDEEGRLVGEVHRAAVLMGMAGLFGEPVTHQTISSV